MDLDKFSVSIRFDEQAAHSTIRHHSEVVGEESNIIIHPSNQSDNTVYIFFLWMAVLYLVSWILLEVMQKLITTEHRSFPILSIFQSPCRNCKFFDDNNYLNCAVHPSIVLTKQAVNCSDYCDQVKSPLPPFEGEVKLVHHYKSLFEANPEEHTTRA